MVGIAFIFWLQKLLGVVSTYCCNSKTRAKSFRDIVTRFRSLNESFGLHDQLDEEVTVQASLFNYLLVCVPVLQWLFLYASPELTCLRYPERKMSARNLQGMPRGVLRGDDSASIPGFMVPLIVYWINMLLSSKEDEEEEYEELYVKSAVGS
jgi:hypothetical protein